MKEEGDWSSERWLPHGSTTSEDRSIIPEWASLPPELVEKIADRVLSTTGGVDAYMDMRAVCSTWRSAIAKPPPLASVVDFRFRPRHWVMVDLKSKNYHSERLFLHVLTGRFRRLRLPVLRDHRVLGASDGLIVLMDCREDSEFTGARVLNPFTGDILQFTATCSNLLRRSVDELRTAVTGGPNSTLVVWRGRRWIWNMVLYADPTSAEFTEEDTGISIITSMVTFQGNIYLAGLNGSVLKFERPAEHCDHEFVITAQMSLDVDIYIDGNHRASSYLVDSTGELLLVRHWDQAFKVFRVDVKHKSLVEVKTMGCRALFLGRERCLSVDANMIPTVDADCIYMSNWVETSEWRGSYMHVYNLRDGTMEILSSEPMLHANIYPKRGSPWYGRWYKACEIFTSVNNHRLPPLSLIQVLLDYCNDLTQF